MEWIVVALLGAALGLLVGFLAQGVRMPQSLSILLGTIGALFGGALYLITRVEIFGNFSFYFLGLLVSVGFLVGGTLAYTLTSREKRV